MNIKHRFGFSVLALAMAVSIYGCEKKAGESGEAAAKVNGDTISMAMVNFEAKKLGQMPQEQLQQASRKVLQNLVDQDLLMQKAIAEKLDQNEEVKLALEAARRQVLSQAFIEKSTADIPPATEQEITDYFNNHPELFSERRIYRLQEINVQVTPENIDAVKAKLAESHSLDDFVQWLKDQKISTRISQAAKPAEQLPTEILPRLAQMRDGQAMTVQAANALNILVVAGSQSQPVTLDQVKDTIERYVTNSKKRDKAAALLKEIHDQAKIEFLGTYADMGKDAAAPAAKAEPTAKPEAPAQPETAAEPKAEAGAGSEAAAGAK